jgi:hypothetical protein
MTRATGCSVRRPKDYTASRYRYTDSHSLKGIIGQVAEEFGHFHYISRERWVLLVLVDRTGLFGIVLHFAFCQTVVQYHDTGVSDPTFNISY